VNLERELQGPTAELSIKASFQIKMAPRHINTSSQGETMDNRRYNNDRSDSYQSNMRYDQNRSSSFDSDFDNRDQNRRQNFSSDYYDRSRSYEGAQDLNNRYERNNVDRNFNQQRSDYDRNRSYTSSSASYPSYPSYGQSSGSYGSSSYGGNYGTYGNAGYGSNAGSSYGSSSNFGSSYDSNPSRYQHGQDRGLMDRAESGWENIKESAKNFFGKGPKGYKRSDERIKEEISDALYRHPRIDASDIEVDVKDGTVTLRGTVEDRQTKRLAEDLAEDCSGVTNVSNQLMVNSNFGSQNPATSATQSQTATTGSTSSGRSKSIQ
jgi:osmotically-inducible protein OsmY